MTTKYIFWLFAFCFFATSLFSQEKLLIDTTLRSIYSEPSFGQQLYRYAKDDKDIAVESKIAAICRAAGLAIDFEVISSNVTSVAVIVTPPKRYLLYSSFFFWSNEEDPSRQYLILAHAIGLLAGRHTLNPQKRIFEETSADEWAGRQLFGLQNAGLGLTLESLLAVIKEEPFGYSQVPLEVRCQAFQRGWVIADGQSNAQKSTGFFLNESNVDKLPLPRYWVDGSPGIYQDNNNKLRRAFTPTKTPTLGKVDDAIRKTLTNAGFQQWSYYVVNNGFAVITQVEQFDAQASNAKCVSGNNRWRDTPPEENIASLLNYLKGFLWPRNGYFRFFVFVVSDQPMPKGREDVKIDPKQVDKLMRCGSNSLTEDMARMAFTTAHKVTILVYEMEVPETTRIGAERVPPKFQPAQHLEGSSILMNIK